MEPFCPSHLSLQAGLARIQQAVEAEQIHPGNTQQCAVPTDIQGTAMCFRGYCDSGLPSSASAGESCKAEAFCELAGSANNCTGGMHDIHNYMLVIYEACMSSCLL